MQTDIGFVIERQLPTVDGKDLLRLLQRCTSARQNRVLTGQDLGEGTPQEPFRLTSAQAWLYCARTKFKGGSRFRLRRNEQALDYNSIVFPEEGKTSPARQKMREIKTAIERRLACLDAL